MDDRLLFFIYLFTVAGGILLEVGVRKLHFLLTKRHYKEHHFSLAKYFLLLLFPFVAMFFALMTTGFKLFWVFAIFAVVGTVLEWLIGWAYYQIEGQRLWTYHRYAIGKYTSYLSIPLWGAAGILFWVLTKSFD